MTASTVQETIEQWRRTYGSPDADPVELMVGRHDPSAIAFTFVDDDLNAEDLTYGQIGERSAKLATVLAKAGLSAGDRVPVLLSKRPELIIALVAIWRLGAVHVPLFTAFASGAIDVRVRGAGAAMVIAEPSQVSKLEHLVDVQVLVVGEEWERAIDAAPAHDQQAGLGPTAPFMQLYTSGTTGAPKGVPVPVSALGGFHSYLHFGLDVNQTDVYWNAADPGWAYGLYYAIVAPMVAGRRSLMTRAGFSPALTAQVISTFGVTNFAGAPTMYRAMSKSAFPAVQLRHASAAGEPLTPDVIAWALQTLGTEVRDHYGQTELGMVIGNGWHPEVAEPLKPGSMGKPLPGHAAAIVDGVIAIDTENSPLLWFTGYAGDPELSASRFTDDGRWYLTGDTGRADEDGYYFFTARDDDLILAAGYRIGPFDVESVLITHPAVVDVAVVGLPDPEGIRGEIVAAFVVVDPEVSTDAVVMTGELQALVRDNYSRHAYPREIRFVETLPKTPSGKVQRYLLRS